MSRELTEGVTQTQERMVLRQEKEENDHGLPWYIYSFPQTRKYPVLIAVWSESNPCGVLMRTTNGEEQTSPALCNSLCVPEHLPQLFTPV